MPRRRKGLSELPLTEVEIETIGPPVRLDRRGRPARIRLHFGRAGSMTMDADDAGLFTMGRGPGRMRVWLEGPIVERIDGLRGRRQHYGP
jgi:hypothetical protein